MRRLTGYLPVALLIVGGITALMGLMLFILSLAAPESVETLGLGTEGLQADLISRTESLESLFGIRPLLDSVLLVGSYVTVCALLWLQQLVGSAVKNSSHFK